MNTVAFKNQEREWYIVDMPKDNKLFVREVDEEIMQQMPDKTETFIERSSMRSFIDRILKFDFLREINLTAKIINGEHIKIIGVDIDNTISATDNEIRKLIKQYYKIGSRKDDIPSWYYSESLEISPDEEKFIFDQFHKYHLNDLQVISGAQKALSVLSEHYKIWLITNRPAYTKQQTKKWLDGNSIIYEKIFFLEQKLSLVSKINYMIDDKAETALDFAFRGIKVFFTGLSVEQESKTPPNKTGH